MKVFLTGATGYIGTVVAEQLQRAGHTIVGLVRSEAAAAKLRQRNIQPLLGDLRDVDQLVYAARQSRTIGVTSLKQWRLIAMLSPRLYRHWRVQASQ